MQHLWAPWRMEYVGGPREEGCFLCRAWTDAARPSDHLVVGRSRRALVMLNRFPYNSGHLMIVPGRHTPGVEDLDAEEAADVWLLLARAKNVLTQVLKPDGFNIGINQGKAGGAGMAEHLHVHIVPRWEGDHNFMTVTADIRVVPQALEKTHALLRDAFQALYADPLPS